MTGRSIKKHICAMPVGKGYARKSKATRYAGGYLLLGLNKQGEKRRKRREQSTAAVAAVAGRRQDGSERAVFVKAEQKRDDDGQSTAVKHVRAEEPVFRAENKQRDQNPKGRITR